MPIFAGVSLKYEQHCNSFNFRSYLVQNGPIRFNQKNKRFHRKKYFCLDGDKIFRHSYVIFARSKGFLTPALTLNPNPTLFNAHLVECEMPEHSDLFRVDITLCACRKKATSETGRRLSKSSIFLSTSSL